MSALSLVGVLLAAAVAACDSDAAQTPTPDPSTAYLAEVRAALDKTRSSYFVWQSTGNVPGELAGKDLGGATLFGHGFFDPGTKDFYRSVSIEGRAAGGKKTRKASAQTVIGNDFYLSEMPPEGELGPAFHIDFDQVPQGTVLYTINRDDPTGIDRFTAAVERVTDKADHQYRGFFTAVPGEFLPIGVPVVGGTGIFTLVTDETGGVNTIDMAVHPADGRSLKFHILFSFLGRKSPISGPKQFSEADESLILKDGT